MSDRENSKRYVATLKVLEKYNLLDGDGHMKNCGYTEEKPSCKCLELGRELFQTIR